MGVLETALGQALGLWVWSERRWSEALSLTAGRAASFAAGPHAR